MNKKIITAAQKLNRAVLNGSQVQERSLTPLYTYAHVSTKVLSYSGYRSWQPVKSKIQPKGFFRGSYYAQNSTSERVSCTRRRQWDLFKAPVGLPCGRTSTLLPYFKLQANQTCWLGMTGRALVFSIILMIRSAKHISYSHYIRDPGKNNA